MDPTVAADISSLEDFHQKCWRQLLGIRWLDRRRNDEVLRVISHSSLSHLHPPNAHLSLGMCLSSLKIWLFDSMSTRYSVDLLTARGDVPMVVHGTSGPPTYR